MLGKEVIRMIICDTNILINAFNGNIKTISDLEYIGFNNIILSSITVMELLQGMQNKLELGSMKEKIKFYDIIHFNEQVSKKAIELVEKYG